MRRGPVGRYRPSSHGWPEIKYPVEKPQRTECLVMRGRQNPPLGRKHARSRDWSSSPGAPCVKPLRPFTVYLCCRQ